MLPSCILYHCFSSPPVSLIWRTALENVYTSQYQRPLLQLYECNVDITQNNGICESKQGFKKMAEMLTLTFLLYKIYIVVFFYLKLTLYYCEVLLISVKPIVNKNK